MEAALEETPADTEDGEIIPENDTPPEPPSSETVHAWLALARPADVLKLLRKPDFAYIETIAFTGVRVNAGSYAIAHVRSRLAQEVTRNDSFAEKLQALAEAASTVPTPPVSLPKPTATPIASEREQVKAERERAKALRTERDAARQSLVEAENAVRAAAASQQQAEAARAESDRLAQEQAHKTTRLERRVAQMQQEIVTLTAERDTLLKAPKPVAPTPVSPGNGTKKTAPTISPWQIAAAHLLDRRKADAVVILAEEVLRIAPDEPAGLELAAQAYEALQDGAKASGYIRTLLEQALAQKRTSDAADAWLRLVRLSTPVQAERALQGLLRILRPEDISGVRHMRLALTRLQGQAPAAHAQASEQITRLASPDLAKALMPLPGALHDDDRLPLDLPFAPSAAQLIAAVRAGDENTVADARESLSRLAVANRDDFERARAALVRAAGTDSSLVQPLLRAPRGPVVVDASNVALHGQDMLVSPRPRLHALLAMRRALLQRGFFPVVAIADANLPHIIDDPQAFEQTRANREVLLVDGGTAADEVLLRESKRLTAPLVTNDYMADWDPQHQVTKIQYTFSHNGDVLFDT